MAAHQSLIQAMGHALTGTPFVPSLDRSPQANIESLVSAVGSGRAAARALGVAESTLRGWRRGVTPRRDPRVFVAAARGALSGDRYAAAYNGDVTFAIKGKIRVSSDERERTVYPGRNIPRQTMQGILRAWATGDDERAERLLYKAIDTNYQPLQFNTVVGVWFE